jgi:phage terminase large subunit-like protein
VTSSLALVQKVQQLKRLRASLLRAKPAPKRTRSTEGVLDLLCRVSPNFVRPKHFAAYAGRFETAVGGGYRLVFAAPPQHGKTEVTLHGLCWIIQKYPGKRHAYITYSQRRANKVAKKVRNLLKTMGVEVGGTLAQMELPGGGQCVFTSIASGLTGEPVDGVAIIDDYYSGRKQADSAALRSSVEDSYREVVETRVHPGGSIFVLATRWHPQDLSGVLVAEGWEYINLPALAEGPTNDNGVVIGDPLGRRLGEALFPELWPVPELEKKRIALLEFGWSALFQGRPRPRGGKVYHEPTFYSERPKEGYRGIFGIDLAYTAKTSADWSICLELWRVDAKKPGERTKYYVIRVDREQCEADAFTERLKTRHTERKSWPMHWRYGGGGEKGAATFIKKSVPLIVGPAPGDKLVCATPAAAAWNAGDILVPDPEAFPECEAWLSPFLDVIGNFTGNGKEVDDDSDALGTAYDKLQTQDSGGILTVKSTR